jgi:hypothetical protein
MFNSDAAAGECDILTARQTQTRNDWNCLPWWRKAALCCAQPTALYVLAFGIIGLLFLLGAPMLDPDLRVVGLILIGVAAGMLVIYLFLAFRAFHRRGARPPECESGR